MEFILGVVGILVGALVVWLILSNKYKASSGGIIAQLRSSDEKIVFLQNELSALKKELAQERNRFINVNSQFSSAKTELKNAQERLQAQKAETLELQQQFAIQFRNLANDIFEEKSKKFTDQNKVNLTAVLSPLKDRILEFEKKVEDSNRQNLEQNTALKEQLFILKEMNLQITKEASNLTKALKGDSKTQGTWGEFILESILEKSGLEKGREYVIQESHTTDARRRLQPDVVIKLPERKNIIIDSKVSLVAYERYVSDEENEAASHLRAHIMSLRSHIKGLDLKQYQKLHGVEGLDFILMFVPVEPAFSAAVQADPNLFSEAYDKNIVIVSPSTLMATLRTIANIWKNEYQNRNALEIARQGGNLYDKFVAFTEDLKKVGVSIDQSQGAYSSAMKKLYEGKDNIIRKTERLRELGAKTSKSIDKNYLDKA